MNKPGRRKKKRIIQRQISPAIFRGKMRKNRAHVQLRPYDPKAARLTRLQIKIFIIRVCQRAKGGYLAGEKFEEEGERFIEGSRVCEVALQALRVHYVRDGWRLYKIRSRYQSIEVGCVLNVTGFLYFTLFLLDGISLILLYFVSISVCCGA